MGPGLDPGPHRGPTGTLRAARHISNMSFNTFTLGAYLYPGAIEVFVCVATGASGDALCGDGFICSQARHTQDSRTYMCERIYYLCMHSYVYEVMRCIFFAYRFSTS